MLRSLFAGISALRAHQQMMDVVSNNIANVNTAGFKSSQTVFEDTLSQMLSSATMPQGTQGGTNPAQVGLGARLGAIATNFGQGGAQSTGRTTDLMINGDGFFIVGNGGGQLQYTRAGSFSFDANGLLVDPQGLAVQGWTAKPDGTIDTNATPGQVRLPISGLLAPAATKNVKMAGNLPADTTSTTPLTASITGYDAQGTQVTYSASFAKVNLTTWTMTLSDGTNTVSQDITFDPNGSNPTPPSVAVGAVTVDVSGITDFAGAATVSAASQDGSGLGSLQGFSISPDGTLLGSFSNGLKQPVAQLALAVFNNPGGLQKVGNSDYEATVNSGQPQLGTAGAGGRGTLQGGALEMSNVDLALEFTNLIVAQRGFQANSKVISTSDELLQDVVNLKR